MSKNFSQIENLMPLKDTLANLQARPRISGVSYYATDTNKNYSDDGVDLVEIGSGGIGSPAIYLLLNADNDKVTDWTNTGSGVFILDTVLPINGTKSYKFTAAVQNDAISRLVTPVFRNKGKENSVSLQYTLDVLGIECQIFDTATSTIIEQIPLTVELSSKTLNLPFILKDTSTTVELRFINTHATNTPTVKFDDISFSDNPFVYKNLLVAEGYLIQDSIGRGAVSNRIVLYDQTRIQADTTGSLFKVVNSTNLGTEVIILKDCTINMSAGVTFSTAEHFGITKNSNELSTNIQQLLDNTKIVAFTTVGSNGWLNTASYTGKVKPGDIFRVHTAASIVQPNATKTIGSLSITAQAESEHVITPVKSNMTDWINTGAVPISATTTAPTKGTTSVDNLFARRVGDSLEIRIEFKQTAGGVSGVGDYLFGIPSTFNGQPILIDTNKVTPYAAVEGSGNSVNNGNIVGNFSYTDGNFSNYYGDVIVYDPVNVRFSMRGGASATVSYNGVIGSTYGQTSVPSVGYFATFKVPIQGWTSDVSILGAIPSKRIAYIKDVKGVGVDGGSSIAGIQTRTLNTLTGDTSFISLNANQITLQKGKYRVYASVPAFRSNSHDSFLWDVGNSTIIIGGSSEHSWNADNTQTRSIINGELNVLFTATFEIRHQTSTAVAANGLGTSSIVHPAVFTICEIEKIG